MGGRGYELCLLSAVFFQRSQGPSCEEPEKDGEEEKRSAVCPQKDKALSINLGFLCLQRLQDDSA